jgi:hypothetical protein
MPGIMNFGKIYYAFIDQEMKKGSTKKEADLKFEKQLSKSLMPLIKANNIYMKLRELWSRKKK